MRRLIKYLLVILIFSHLFSGCKKECRDQSFMYVTINSKDFVAKGNPRCSVFQPNVIGFLTDNNTHLELSANLYTNTSDENYFLSIEIKDTFAISPNKTYMCKNYFENNIYSFACYSLISNSDEYFSFNHSGTVTITNMEELEDGQYRIDGRFEALLVNEAGTDTLRITGGEFRTVTE